MEFICSILYLENHDCLLAILKSKEVTVQARACGLMGNLLRHTDEFYSVLKEKEELIDALLMCLVSSETDVRKVCVKISNPFLFNEKYIFLS